jgi:pimeloyl-ACP methyl ester carboxylesterase
MKLFDRFIAGEKEQIDHALRAKMPERFIHLSSGDTFVEQSGPPNGEPVVLLHGFSVPLFIWDPTVEELTKQGFRVIRYDLLGRGYSDRPDAKYSISLFVNQLEQLFDALEIQGKVNLISLSMGGVIAAVFAAKFPDRIKRIAFIDPAGFKLNLPWETELLRWPVIGEILLGLFDRFGSSNIVDGMLADFYDPTQEAVDYFVPRYKEQMRYQGFKRALLSTLRQGVLDEDLAIFQALSSAKYPVQLIWGEDDRTVPFKHSNTFLELIPRTVFHPIPRAGHIPHFERPDLVNSLLIEFLKASTI